MQLTTEQTDMKYTLRFFRFTEPIGKTETRLIKRRFWHHNCTTEDLIGDAESWASYCHDGWVPSGCNESGLPVAVHPSGARAEYIEVDGDAEV